MDNVAIRYIFDRTNSTGYKKKVKGVEYKETGLLQVEVRKIGTSEKTYISLGIKLRPDQFSPTNGFTCINHPFHFKVTSDARDKFNKIYSFVTSDKCKSIEDVSNWDKDTTNDASFMEFFDQIKSIRSLKITYNTLKNHNVLYGNVQSFGKFRTFDDLTYENMVLFDAHLRKEKLEDTTIYKRHSILRSYINEAVNMGYVQVSPYNRFKPTRGKYKERDFLSEDEIREIQSIDYSTSVDKKKERVRDLFIFQCFTGLAYSDVIKFKKDDIFKLDGYDVIRGTRQKTDEPYVIYLADEAKEVLEKYNYELPIISNQKYNDYLKLIAIEAKINKNITSHIGRHTYATLLLNRGAKIESVSTSLGHTNIKQTQVYAKMLAKTSMEDIAKHMKKKKH